MAQKNISDSLFSACQRALLALSVLSAVLGLLLCFATSTPLFHLYSREVLLSFLGEFKATDAVVDLHRWGLAVVGAGTTGWAIMMCFVVAIPFKKREVWAWWSMFVSVSAWIVLDLVSSMLFGVLPEVVFALVALAFFSAPLVISFPAFSRRT